MTENASATDKNTAALPAVSCMCLTYGRVGIVDEALQCFLRQDYGGPKELIILNDLAEQTLVFDHPEVCVINLNKQFRTVGEKRNAGVALASHDILLPWDDDDIFYPHRIRISIEQLRARAARFYKPNKAFYGHQHKIDGIVRGHLHPSSCFTRDLFNEVGGYPHIGSGQDIAFEAACRKAGAMTSWDTATEDLFYFYRWEEISHHLSQYALFEERKKNPQVFDDAAEVRREVDADLRSNRQPRGVVQLAPTWRHDYERLRRDHLAAATAGDAR